MEVGTGGQGERLAVVTVCMNRREHLLATAPRVAAWPHHHEHLIVDWSSREPLRREELPADPRLRLLRVEGEKSWNISRAYNFALAQTRADRLLKLDADCWPTGIFDPAPLLRQGPLWVGAGPEGRHGQFLMPRALFSAIGGFNEFMSGWGFEDKDLRARLEVQQGVVPEPIPTAAIGVITHSDAERMGQSGRVRHRPLQQCRALATMRASRLGNRLMAAHCPWGPRRPASTYVEERPGHWRVEPASVPRPSPEVIDEIDHARRIAFWGCFLGLPEVALDLLPLKLVPLEQRGVWPVRWWHRLHWYTGRPLLLLPALVLSLGRGRLQALRRGIAPA